jgi:hypothetical protein
MTARIPVWLRAISFLVIAPGSVLGLFPWWITDGHLRHGSESALLQWIAIGL